MDFRLEFFLSAKNQIKSILFISQKNNQYKPKKHLLIIMTSHRLPFKNDPNPPKLKVIGLPCKFVWILNLGLGKPKTVGKGQTHP